MTHVKASVLHWPNESKEADILFMINQVSNLPFIFHKVTNLLHADGATINQNLLTPL